MSQHFKNAPSYQSPSRTMQEVSEIATKRVLEKKVTELEYKLR